MLDDVCIMEVISVLEAGLCFARLRNISRAIVFEAVRHFKTCAFVPRRTSAHHGRDVVLLGTAEHQSAKRFELQASRWQSRSKLSATIEGDISKGGVSRETSGHLRDRRGDKAESALWLFSLRSSEREIAVFVQRGG